LQTVDLPLLPAQQYKFMIAKHLHALFWDADLDVFEPAAYPDYSIFRVLEFGDEGAVAWMRQTFSETEIRRVLREEHRLSPKSANFWALVYGVAAPEVASLRENRQLSA
jgi:hypothetical protein